MAYIKNVTDETAITGAFLNSDDTGLTTNVFLTEPRLYGLRMTKTWTGGSLLGSFGARHEGPYPFTVEIGGQVQRFDAPDETVLPSFSDAFNAPLDVFGQAQEADLDWGDGRELKLTYRPSSGPWTIAAQTRFGRTNAHNAPAAQQQTEPVCGFSGPLAFLCQPDDPKYGPYSEFSEANWSDASVVDRESYDLLDLLVGRDVGFGALSRSTVSGGLRHAHFESTTRSRFRGTPDWGLYPGFIFDGVAPGVVEHSLYGANSDSAREFRGLGPVINWDAAYPLLGNETSGRLEVDWSLGGGVLFGDQETAFRSSEQGQHSSIFGAALTGLAIAPATNTPIALPGPVDEHRQRSTSVPMAAASLGLSYHVDRIDIGAGYRWERYYDVLDAGSIEAKDYDRIIDGPYFKVSVGFGG
jgi:hypothetical protein